ncbi:MAG: cation transporting ATPase C-terminal domain-containing protein, partial [Anaeroplasmataceae bacterium]|nr:cation transporting ATPase C-terminal domain-containing protein [Anaeroplasmataceae bacterium]
GGLILTLGYGIVITFAVIMAYFTCGWLNGAVSLSEIKSLYNSNPQILHQAQTMAFTTLALCELFHMLGMSNVNRSFIHVIKDKNWMLFIAFFIGIVLQLFVVQTPGVKDVFSTYSLTGVEWGIMLGLSLLPLIVHELVVLINWIRKNKK